MQINITLDEYLVKRAQELTGIEASSQAVQEALRALLALRSEDKTDKPDSASQPDPAVVKSLERSLTENADIWSELAKH